jgi:type I restriction enzyme S subunit
MLFKESIKRFTPPKGWNWASISDVAKLSFSSVDKKSVEGEKAVRLCNYMDVFYNRRIREGMPFMASTASDTDIKKFTINKDDVVLTKDSETPEEIAFAAVIDEQIENLVCGYHLAVLRPDKAKVTGEYLMSAINFHPNHHQFVRLANGATRFGLGIDSLNNALIPLPPLDEQRKIAEILRTWDEAIETAEAELKAKQERKRWLMDKLLVGDWAVKKLDDLFELEGSGIDKVILQGEQVVPLVNYMDAYRKRILEPSDITAQTSVSPADLSRCKLKRGDIVLTPSSETPDDIAHSALIDFEPGDAVHSYHLFRLRARSDSAIIHDFRAFFLNHISVRKQFIRICSGTTRFTLTLPGVRGIKVSLPPAEHQKYAAAVLGDATSQELLASQRIETLRAQKRGLMQKLLTGEVRVAA